VSKKGFEFQTREQMMKKRKHTADEDGTPLVVFPSDSEMALALNSHNLCMFCRNWDHEGGQAAIKEEKFWPRILKEEKYRREWFEADPNCYGLCKVFEGRLRPNIAPATCMKSDLDQSLYSKPGGMDQVPCPGWSDKRVHGSRMIIGAHSKTKLEH
jgi:hypothetical protein